MGNIDFNAVFETLKEGVTDLAKVTVQNYLNDAKADGIKLVESLKTDIKTWGEEFIAGKLTEDDIKYLVLAKKELIEMNALKQAGLSLVKVDEFKNGLLQLVIKTIIGLI